MLGEKEKAVAIMDKVAQNSVEYLRFAASLNREQKRVMDSTIGRESAILSYVLQICERNNENELVEKYYQDYANYAK
jgi:hypothetical protein